MCQKIVNKFNLSVECPTMIWCYLLIILAVVASFYFNISSLLFFKSTKRSLALHLAQRRNELFLDSASPLFCSLIKIHVGTIYNRDFFRSELKCSPSSKKPEHTFISSRKQFLEKKRRTRILRRVQCNSLENWHQWPSLETFIFAMQIFVLVS